MRHPARRFWGATLAGLCLSGLSLTGTIQAADTTDGVRFTQVPAIAASNQQREPVAVTNPAKPEAKKADLFKEGPTPNWIWGGDANKKYYLKTEFTTDAKTAQLRIAADNHAKIWLNDQEVLTNDEWKEPSTADVSKQLKPGKNLLLAEVRNAGGTSGFILKLVLTGADGKSTYVISDDKWTAAESKDAETPFPVKVIAKLGSQPWGNSFLGDSPAATVARGLFQVLPGFQVEQLFTVPKDKLGSWVCITTDNKGRLIVSDQGDKGLCRITPPAIGSQDPTLVERLNVKISAAQGMLYAFDSLYVSVNGGQGSGLYRVRDTDADDQFDEVTKLASFKGGGEHGPHSLRLSPDGKSIVVICGNHTDPIELNASRIRTNWSEDHLLPRQWDANGHAVGKLAPGGWIAQTDPDGKTWEMLSMGYRNPYDMAFNADGELFAYDADMEWDMGMPWYRPTRVAHAVSGSEFGWRSGTGKWPSHYVDSLPQMIDIGPGSPVGVDFGYGTKFPAKYQKALFICDWTFGTMYAIHIEPNGASYKATKEEFVARTPLPLTDTVVGKDGALYFTIGGRGTQSELFRVTYVGQESTAPVDARDSKFANLRTLRRNIEAYHRPSDPSQAIPYLLPFLSHEDRFIRYAARVALEHQDVSQWQDKVLAETKPTALITGVVGLARQADKALQPRLLAALDKLDFGKLTEDQQLDALRAWSLIFIRLDAPDAETAARLAKKLDAFFPAKSDTLNRELCNMLVYLKSPTIAAKVVALLQQPTTYTAESMGELLTRNPGYGGTVSSILANLPDAQKLHYVFALRNLKEHWTIDQRKVYFQYLDEARTKKGGASYQGFLRNIDKDAYENATDAERLAVEAAGARKPFKLAELPQPKGPGQDWTLDQLLELSKTEMKGRNFDNGKKMFAATRCVICHRFQGDGGATGPDLTQLAGRFNVKDLTEAIVDPSKVVSDQYKTTVVQTKSGKTYTGRVISLTAESLVLLIDPEDSTKIVEVKKSDIEEQMLSNTSLMPKDLLKALNKDEVLDLLAYLLSRGNKQDEMFKK